ncbi:N-6 DNA methylase [Adlercreutzia sp. R21]|uniref:N-6 DNA methylase n=1 Tax=Adlercreutzia wanghongyangiae TaxID=3111451 RepID=UPI002DBCFE42|nr:N-6 DNA methylase [Adlercreutzia sp. R21]MEC4184523.1 N-6 DNA methylase [Adlercreutzia sp. R21]
MIEMKRVQDIATFYNSRCVSVRGTERLLRQGPYPLYVETGTVPFDDFLFDGAFIVQGGLCNIENERGCFAAQYVKGRFSASPFYHVLACDCAADTRYLREVLVRTPVRGRADAGGQSTRLSENSLRHLPVPWPGKRERAAFVSLVDAYNQEATALKKQVGDLTEGGVKIFQDALDATPAPRMLTLAEMCRIVPGRSLDASARSNDGHYPVVSSQGVVGHTDESGIDEPCLVIGQAGQFLVGQLMTEGAFPLSDSVALVMKEDAPLSITALSFALFNEGIRPRLRIVDHQVDARAMPLDSIGSLAVAVPDDSLLPALIAQQQDIEDRIVRLGEIARAAEHRFAHVVAQFMEGDEQAVPMLPQSPHAALRNGVEAAYRNLSQQSADATYDDAAWEVLPFAVARSLLGHEQWSTIANTENAAEAALNALCCELHSLNLSGSIASLLEVPSALDLATRNEVVRDLDVPLSQPMSGADIRWLTQTYKQASPQNPQEYVSLAPTEAVVELIAQLADIFCPHSSSALDPCALSGEVLAALRKRNPDLQTAGLTPLPSDALADAFGRLCDNEDASPLTAGHALQERSVEIASLKRFDIVASILPCNEGEWATAMPRAEDPRWIFGIPPRNKANLAWLQHAFACRAEGGVAVLAAANAILHESRGSEPSTRAALIESGCVRAVIALPGRIFADRRPPMSILVMGDKRGEDSCETLFINLLGQGENYADASNTAGPSQVLPAFMVNQTAAVVKSWLSGESSNLPSFARVIPKSLIRKEGVLTPWTFVCA